DKCQPNHKHQETCRYGCDLPVEFVAGQAADHDEQEYRDVNAQERKHHAAQHDGADDDDEYLPVELAECFFCSALGKTTISHDCADQGLANAQPEREVAWSHAGSGAHAVLGGAEGEAQTYHHKHNAGPKIRLISYPHVFTSPRQR